MPSELNKLLKQFNHMYFLRKEYDQKSKDLLEQMQALTPIIENLMVDEGIKKVSFTDGTTSSLKSVTWAKVNDKEKALELLKKYQEEHGTNNLILDQRPNYQGLSALIREYERNEEDLPEEWKNVIEPNPVTSIVPKKT